jgi:hypothetical protein
MNEEMHFLYTSLSTSHHSGSFAARRTAEPDFDYEEILINPRHPQALHMYVDNVHVTH